MSFAELLSCAGVQERLVLGGPVGFLAFHGGLEGGTAEAAEAAAASAGASLYTVVQPATLRWHIPSHRVGPDASEALAAFLSHVEAAVALHGYGRPHWSHHLLVGGGNRTLASLLATHLRTALPGCTVVDHLADIPTEMRGLHPRNPANLPSGGGVQLELPPIVRGASPRPSDRGRPCQPAPALIEALVQTARQWPAYSTGNVPPARQ